MHIRQACAGDASRIAEILVFNNRLNFFPIFRDEQFSFGEMQVVPIVQAYLSDSAALGGVYVYDDGLVRGFVQICGREIKKLYVDPFFQNRGVGAALLDYALAQKQAAFLWALEKNVRAIRFYQRHGFRLTQERALEEGTTEYLVKLER